MPRRQNPVKIIEIKTGRLIINPIIATLFHVIARSIKKGTVKKGTGYFFLKKLPVPFFSF